MDTPDPQAEPREQRYGVPTPWGALALTRLGALPGAAQGSVLYVHGATFPSACSIAFRFDGCSWRDTLCAAGFDVWGLDFIGFGRSDRYAEMRAPADAHGPLGLAAQAAVQLEHAARHILQHDGVSRLSFISHSWGSMPLGLLAAAHPALVDRIVMFAPLARREGPRYAPRPMAPAWREVSLDEQYRRFVEDVPAHEAPVLERRHFDAWSAVYLDSDEDSRGRSPPRVRTPTGPVVEIQRAWHGELAWEPAGVQAPVAIIRGSWDGLVADADAAWLMDALSHSAERRDIKIGRATHLMHLEVMREALWRESVTFLSRDPPAARIHTHPSRGTHGMQDHHESKDLPGYDLGAASVARSPISLQELQDLKASALFTDEDLVYLRLSYDVLKDQAEDLVIMWRGIIAQHTHLASYSWDTETHQPDKDYGAAVGKRFAQWVLDTARAEYDQAWLDYQYEIGLRHHRRKKNATDHVHTAAHIRGRDLIAFAAATVAPMRPYLEKGGHSRETVQRMQDAWWKSMILQVTLWSQPYMNPGDF